MSDLDVMQFLIYSLMGFTVCCLMWDIADSLRYIGARLEDIDNGVRRY